MLVTDNLGGVALRRVELEGSQVSLPQASNMIKESSLGLHGVNCSLPCRPVRFPFPSKETSGASTSSVHHLIELQHILACKIPNFGVYLPVTGGCSRLSLIRGSPEMPWTRS